MWYVCVNEIGLHDVIYWFVWKFCPHVDMATDHVFLFMGVAGQAIVLYCRVLFNGFLWLLIYYLYYFYCNL